MLQRNKGATPWELARSWAARDGLVFFDSARVRSGSISRVACEPREVLEGDIFSEAARLDALLGANAGAGGGLAGWIGYDGRFKLGVYRQFYTFSHDSRVWVGEAPDLWETVGPGSWPGAAFGPDLGREEYLRLVRRALDYIAAGDIYQANIAQRFRAKWAGEPFGFYERLRQFSPAPYGAFLRLGGTSVLSTSPELFLQMRQRAIRTRPIKGTRPRLAEQGADERSAADLLTSAKEAAELLMITDLERNDLGQVCEFGSVVVPEIVQLERYAQVFHLVSTVRGRLREDVGHAQALAACFPGGSITGAPKKRAREIIAELEPVERGIYTGALGYFGFDGRSQFNIAIRTVVVEQGSAQFHTGAGIVADSQPEQEYQETLDKAAGILAASAVQ